MAKKFVFVKPNGMLTHCTTPSNPAQYSDGETYGELLVVEIPYEDDAMDYLMKRLYLDGAFLDIIPSSVAIDKVVVLADGVDFVLLSLIEPNSELVVVGTAINIATPTTSDMKAITFDTVGEYVVTIKNLHHFDYKVTINAQ